MSGLDNILARLKEENETQCAGIAADADARAAQIVSLARADAEETIRTMEADANKEAAQLEARARSAGALNSRQALLRAKITMIDETLAEAQNQLHGLPAETYFGTLAALANKNRQPGQGVLCLNEKDLARMPADFAAKLGEGITVSETPAEIEDGFLLKYGSIEFNCTLKALFDAARDALRAQAGEILFG